MNDRRAIKFILIMSFGNGLLFFSDTTWNEIERRKLPNDIYSEVEKTAFINMALDARQKDLLENIGVAYILKMVGLQESPP